GTPSSWTSTVAVVGLGGLGLAAGLGPAVVPEAREEFRSYRAQPALPIAADAGHLVGGRAEAPRKIWIVGDFACPACAQLEARLRSRLDPADPRTALFYIHFPGDPAVNPYRPGHHPEAGLAARVAISSWRRGRFAAARDLLQ